MVENTSQANTQDLAEYISGLRDRLQSEGMISRAHGDLVDPVLDDVVNGKLHDVSKPLAKLRNAAGASELYERLRQELNIWFEREGKEVTSHGIHRTFRFWPQERKVKFVTELQRLIATIHDRITPNVCVAYGSALGVARTGGFIPHDDDVDLLVGLPADRFRTFQDARDFIVSRFEGTDYRTRLVAAVPGLLHVNGGFHTDVFVGLEEGPYISSFPGPRRTIRIDDVFPAEPRQIEGGDLPFPRQIENYVSKVYGADWKVPQPNWSHDWNIAKGYADVLRR